MKDEINDIVMALNSIAEGLRMIASSLSSAKPNTEVKNLTRNFYDVNQASDELNVAKVTLRKWIRTNRISRMPNFRKILISKQEMEKFISNNK